MVPVRLFRCGRSCGSCDCPRVGSMPGDGCSTRVHLTIGRPVRTRRPIRLTPPEVRTIKDMVTALEYRHVPTGTLVVLAQRLGKVWASPSTWYHLVRKVRLAPPPAPRAPGQAEGGASNDASRRDVAHRHHRHPPARRNRAYLHAVIDNFSRRILAWRVADTFAPVNSVAVLVEASRGVTPSATTSVVLADAGVENVNAQVDDLITTGVLRRVLAFTELKFSNSMIEAWWRSLKHQWLFLHSWTTSRPPSTDRILRRRTQSRASAFGVSRTNA
jgi:putative transposase